MKFAFPLFPRQSDWLPIIGFAIAAVVVGWINGFAAPDQHLLMVCLNMLLCLAIASYVTAQQLFPTACAILAFSAWVVFLSMTMGHANYVLTSLNLPLWDRPLAAIDAFFGFDHVAIRNGTGSNEVLSNILMRAYTKTGWQLYLAVGLLFVMRDFKRLTDTFSILTLGVVATIVISSLMPAVGTFPYFNLSDTTAPYLKPVNTGGYVAHYTALRDGSMRAFPQGDWQGLVTFPSFHVIFSLVGLYAVAHIRALAVLSAAFTAVVVVSIVPVGGHYVIDIAGGVGLWCLAVWWVERRRASETVVTSAVPAAPVQHPDKTAGAFA